MGSVILDELRNEEWIVAAVVSELARITAVQRKLGETFEERDAQTVHAGDK